MPRSSGPSLGGGRTRLLVVALGGAAVVAVIVVALALALGGGGTDARAALEAAGCTLTEKPALVGTHSVPTPEGTSDRWETDPPTSGPHYPSPAIYGIYDEPVNQAQIVHNLEHGAVAVQYGDQVPAATVEQLKAFTQAHPRGTILAPYPKLGAQIALGAWVVPNPEDAADGTGYLATCDAFDDAAFEAFLDAYQFKGPERFPADTLLPGRM